ncbi:MAG: tRNA (guanosine(46)-N7)-methyltransferase TrmB [Opitutaceae bacterium]
MEISEAHARELEKQVARKKELKAQIEADLAGVDSILFEAGCGHGHWLADYAKENPNTICIGIDLITWRIRKGLDKKEKRGLENLYFYKAELGEFLEVLPKRIQFDRTIMLFPDPWPKAKHHRRRMIQHVFLDEVAERTAVGGTFCFRTDDRPYFDWAVEHLDEHSQWEIDATIEWPYESETYFQSLMDGYHSVVARRS